MVGADKRPNFLEEFSPEGTKGGGEAERMKLFIRLTNFLMVDSLI